MNIVVLTSKYPYGQGEEFLEAEMKYLGDSFDKVFIITLAKSRQLTKYLPPNAEVITARGKVLSKSTLLKVALRLLSLQSVLDLKKSYARVYKYNISFFARIRRLMVYFYYATELTNILKKHLLLDKAQIFYSYWLTEGAYTLSLINRTNRKICCIARSHSGDSYSYLQYHPFIDDIISGLDRVYCISEFVKNDLQKNVQGTYLNNNKFKVASLGILNNKACSNPSVCNESTFVIVSCSHIVKVKRVDFIIDTLKQLSVLTNNKIEWIHFGDGSLNDDMIEFARKSFEQVRNLKYIFKGYVPNSVLLDFYQNNHIDLFLNLSDSEGIPVSIMEAMSFGIPALVRNIDAITEIVNNRNGIVVKENAKDVEIAQLINKFMDLPQEDVMLKRREARYTFIKKFNAEKNYEIFIKDMKELWSNKQK